MNKRAFFLLVGLLIALLLSGCKCTNEGIQSYQVILDNPIGHVLAPSPVVFDWHGTDSCEPDHFHINIKENRYYGATEYDANLPGDSFSQVIGTLPPATEHVWTMKAVNEYDPQQTVGNIGDSSEPGYFYTGPVCTGGPLLAPDLEIPRDPSHVPDLDNWISHSGPQDFQWSYPGNCLPESYDYQFASDAAFTNIVLSGTTTEPYLMHLYETFPNCSSLYWRIAARVGSTVGPWSDAWQFHWVEDETCWQNLYISDDAARINVLLYQDICDQTGYNSGSVSALSPGCAVNQNNNLIYGDGVSNAGDWFLWSYTVDLGAGPCPSTGLDQMEFSYFAHDEYFNVLAPGTYCVSISKDQSPSQNGPALDMNDGIWTDPFTPELIAYKEVTLGPGTQDVFLEFGWDEYDLSVLWIPMPEMINCRVGPDPICDPLAILEPEELMPIMARDRNTEWKMTAYGGEACFVYLPAVQVEAALADFPGTIFSLEDLPFFDPQPPCPEPEQVRACSDYKNQDNCAQAGCAWISSALRAPYCTDK